LFFSTDNNKNYKKQTCKMASIQEPGSSDFGFTFEIAWEVVNKG
jgi:hypothetical protein